MNYRTGKLPTKDHRNTLYMANYLAPNLLPSPATKVYREYKTPPEAKQFFGNNKFGDCTFAAAANHLILTTCHTGQVVIPTLDEVLAGYSAVTGFDPAKTQPDGSNPTDNGAVMTDVLEYLRTTGLAGHKILAWAKIDHHNLVHRQLGVDIFGATYVGVALPDNAEDQFDAGASWELTAAPNKDNGHCILRPGYGRLGSDYVSWARWDQKASSTWDAACIDEEYVIVTSDWLNRVTQLTPGGLNLPALISDMKAIRS